MEKASREELEEAALAMIECERWEYKLERVREFLDALEAHYRFPTYGKPEAPSDATRP